MFNLATATAPHIDYAGLAPYIAVFGGAIAALMVGLFKSDRVQKFLVPALAIISLLVAGDLSIRLWGDQRLILEGALVVDNFSLAFFGLVLVTAIVTVLYSTSSTAVKLSRSGEYHALLLASVGGMMVLVSAQNMITFFIGLELLSIPLYVLCGSLLLSRKSLESGLKYLIMGSVGSATLLYGLAFIYGATGSTDFASIAHTIAGSGDLKTNPILLVGAGLVAVGLAFKASVAPFHQWTPDVYQGAPTPITAFMAVATKAAALAAIVRVFEQTLPGIEHTWTVALSALAVVTILVGNIGAINQNSLKRMLAYSGVAQAGYMLVGVIVTSTLGANSLIFYLIAYLLMNLAAFGVIVARERETKLGDRLEAFTGLGQTNPIKATVMTISMLSLAGFPATIGFVGKFYLIEAAANAHYEWLAVMIVIGTMISLLYYLRVVGVMWLGSSASVISDAPAPLIAGASPEAEHHKIKDRLTNTGVAAILALATLFFGIVPEPIVNLAEQAGRALGFN